jgi:hypothetical protein
MTLVELYLEIRSRFPELASKADEQHKRLWGPPKEEDPYMWFESLAKAINTEMETDVEVAKFTALLRLLDSSLEAGTEELRSCIDVGFMENLFWQVASKKAEPYWAATPDRLKKFYIAFFGYTQCCK